MSVSVSCQTNSIPSIFPTPLLHAYPEFLKNSEIGDGICYVSEIDNLNFDKIIPRKEISIKQREDPVFSKYFDFLERDILPSNVKLANTIEQACKHLVIHNQVLCRLFMPPGRGANNFIRQIMIPKSLILNTLKWCHESPMHHSTHLSFDYSMGILLSNFYWKNCYAQLLLGIVIA